MHTHSKTHGPQSQSHNDCLQLKKNERYHKQMQGWRNGALDATLLDNRFIIEKKVELATSIEL